MMKSFLTIALAAGLLGGCATRGTVTINCPEFRTSFVEDVPEPDIIQVIHGQSLADVSKQFNGELYTDKDVEAYPQSVGGQKLLAAMKETMRLKHLDATEPSDPLTTAPYKEPIVLLLSGGGQWGAYGAAYLNHLQSSESNQLPKFVIITGVSTGALQALYVSAGQAQQTTENTNSQLAALQTQYSPEKESDIVNRGGLLGAALTGSVAGLKPLRKRIEAALCPPDSKREPECPLIHALADPNAPSALVGFVDAKTGKMQFVDVKAIASHPDLSNKEKQQCITGATMASVAVPFYYQQVRISSIDPETKTKDKKPRTYYDGGVRQSVFFAYTDAITKAAITKAGWQPKKAGQAPPRTIFMMRNGPTLVRTDASPDTKADAITAASRGYQLLVNQSEIASLAAIRPLFPKANIYLTTADGHEQPFNDPKPEKPRGVVEYPAGCSRDAKSLKMMFDPQFMSCLRAFGRYKADTGWIKLPNSVEK